jgi:hypothetical protein
VWTAIAVFAFVSIAALLAYSAMVAGARADEHIERTYGGDHVPN